MLSIRRSARLKVRITKYRLVKIKVILEPQEEGGYTVYAPSLPGCISEGDSKEEAIRNITEAIELYLEADESEVQPSKSKEIVEVTI